MIQDTHQDTHQDRERYQGIFALEFEGIKIVSFGRLTTISPPQA